MRDENFKNVSWRVVCHANIKKVFDLIATDSGRTKFWCEQSTTSEDHIHMIFPGGETETARILKYDRPTSMEIIYFGAVTKFQITELRSGCVVHVEAIVRDADFDETNAGWVSVLMNLKAVSTYDIDLRNHKQDYSWARGFIDN